MSEKGAGSERQQTHPMAAIHASVGGGVALALHQPSLVGRAPQDPHKAGRVRGHAPSLSKGQPGTTTGGLNSLWWEAQGPSLMQAIRHLIIKKMYSEGAGTFAPVDVAFARNGRWKHPPPPGLARDAAILYI